MAVAALVLASVAPAAPATGAGDAEVAYTPSAEALLVSFREIWPEFADQDPTPLIRIYGDGRVVVHLAAYMKRHGVYEMWLPRHELDALLIELTPVLLAFEEDDVQTRKREAEARLLTRSAKEGGPIAFQVADAEISVFRLAIKSYRPPGAGPAISLPALQRVWRGLHEDAEHFPDLEPIQALRRAERILRALGERKELTWVAPALP